MSWFRRSLVVCDGNAGCWWNFINQNSQHKKILTLCGFSVGSIRPGSGVSDSCYPRIGLWGITYYPKIEVFSGSMSKQFPYLVHWIVKQRKERPNYPVE